MSDPSGWATTRCLHLRTRTMFVTGTRTWMELHVLPESMMAALGSEGLSCKGKTGELGSRGGEKSTKIIYSRYYTIYNI